MMNYEMTMERIRERIGVASNTDAEQICHSTIRVLGETIPDRDKDLLFGHLPPQLMRILRDAQYQHQLGVEEILRRVGSSVHAGPGIAIEELQIVCEELAHEMNDDVKRLLHKHLPNYIAALFREHLPATPAHPIETRQSTTNTGSTLASGRPTAQRPIADARPQNALATGRPGSEHPVSEADPLSTAHQESVARSPNPHGSSKLSSGSR